MHSLRLRNTMLINAGYGSYYPKPPSLRLRYSLPVTLMLVGMLIYGFHQAWS